MNCNDLGGTTVFSGAATGHVADTDMSVMIKKQCGDKDVTRLGAFEFGKKIDMTVGVMRAMNVSGIKLRLCYDGGAEHDFDLVGGDCAGDWDVFKFTFDTEAIFPKNGWGLFFYELRIFSGDRVYVTNSINNVDFTVSSNGQTSRFYMSVYEKGFSAPEWFGKGVMYHVFVDRFYKGDGDCKTSRTDIEMNNDWDNGIPQYAPYPGAELKNDMFFGGNLYGVIEKLDYLESLGVTVIYLSPIFKAYSNHKYDTGDYLEVDEMFGGDKAFDELIKAADARGMKVILDGVFNHTGDDSRYFNKKGKYEDSVGAYQSEESKYRNWFCFKNYPDEYESWWGIDVLPKLNHGCEDCRKFFTAEDGVGAKYINRGIGGWRLDVADELSDTFLDEFRASVKDASDGKAIIIGEVWENAATKIAYSSRRRYFSGKQLDSVMNYPVRSGILGFVKYGDGQLLYNTLTELYASYPQSVSGALMNLLGTHDTERILTVLGATEEDFDRPNGELATAKLSKEKREAAIGHLKMAATLQFTVFGIPSVFYGDEVGIEGYRDPFCRMPFPWKDVDGEQTGYRVELLRFYRALGELRRLPALCGGDFKVISYGEGHIVYQRQKGNSTVTVAANRGTAPITVERTSGARIALSVGELMSSETTVTLCRDGVCVIVS